MKRKRSWSAIDDGAADPKWDRFPHSNGLAWDKGGLCRVKVAKDGKRVMACVKWKDEENSSNCIAVKNGRKGMRGSERSEGMMTLGAKESLGCNCGSNH
jgi:hypothetical protein